MAFKKEVGTHYEAHTSFVPKIVIEFLNTVIGYLLMTNYDRVAKFLNKSKKVDEEL